MFVFYDKDKNKHNFYFFLLQKVNENYSFVGLCVLMEEQLSLFKLTIIVYCKTNLNSWGHISATILVKKNTVYLSLPLHIIIIFV